jgi:type I restriction enzyme S subunit
MKAGWEVKTLGSLSEVITKGTTPTSVGYSFITEGINFVKVESITENGHFLKNKLAHITQDCHNALKRSQLKSGDILFSIAGALGRTAFVTEDILPANINQALAIIRLKKTNNLLPEFILKALETGFTLEQIEKFKGGVAQQNLSLGQIQEFQIPIPPLPEQQRIVAILDKAFASIATAKANTEKNLKNARALFDNYLHEVFSQRGEGWEVKTLGEVFKTGAGGTPLKSKKEYYDGGSIPWLLSGEVSQGEIKESKNFITQKGLENSSARIFPKNTVLVAMYGATAGQIGILRFEAATNQAVCGILPNDNFLPEFIFYFLLSRKNELIAQASGNAQPNISQIKIKNTDFLIAPLPEQQRIVAKLDALRTETQRLETLYQRKITALDELKKALLHQAFSGEL